jgi:hypothetical protein
MKVQTLISVDVFSDKLPGFSSASIAGDKNDFLTMKEGLDKLLVENEAANQKILTDLDKD